MVVSFLLSKSVVFRLFFINFCLIWEVHALVNNKSYLINDYAVSWDSVALIEVYNIANNQISNQDSSRSSIGSPVDSNLLVIDLVFESEELLLFDIVAN